MFESLLGNMGFLFYSILVFWYIFVIVLICYIYFKNGKPYDTTFKEKIYKELPSDLSSSELSYLLYHKVRPEVLTSNILSLIVKKSLVIIPKEGDYILKCGEANDVLTKLEEFTLGMVIDLIGDHSQVKLSQIKNYCHDYRTNSDFLFQYTIWHKIARNEAMKKQFYEPKYAYQWVKYVCNVGALLFVGNVILGYHLVIGYLVLLLIWFVTFYFHNTYKRTFQYQEEYEKWLAFKNYLFVDDKISLCSDFVKPSIILEAIYNLNKKYPDLANVEFAYQLNESIKKCYRSAFFKGGRSF